MSQLGNAHMMFKAASGGSSYDTDAQNYINAVLAAGGSLTTTQQNGIDRWFRDMKGQANGSYTTYNVFSRIMVAYLYTQGVSAARDCINAVNPGTYNGTDTGSPTYNSTNKTVTFNGTSQYTNTNFVPNNSATFAGSDFTGFGIHRVDTNNDGNAAVGELGGANSYVVIQASFLSAILLSNTIMNQAQTRSVNRLWCFSHDSSTSANSYYNGANVKNTAVTYPGFTPIRSLLIGAFNNASPGFPGTSSTVDFFFEVKGAWTDLEQGMIYNAGKALKTALGGTAWI